MLLEQRNTALRPWHRMGTGPRRDVPSCHPRWPQRGFITASPARWVWWHRGLSRAMVTARVVAAS